MVDAESAPSRRQPLFLKATIGLLAILGAVFSAGNALSANNLVVPPLRGLGAPFYAVDIVARRDSALFLAATQDEIDRQQRALLEERMKAKLPVAVVNQVPMPSASQLRQSALDAVAGNGLSSVGATVGSFAALTGGDKEGAKRLMALSQKLSRRDQSANLWLMRNYLINNELKAALRQFDVMVRSISDPPVDLFRQIVPLLEDRGGRSALLDVIRGNPNWFSPLLEAMVAYAPKPGKVASLLIDAEIKLPDTPRLAPIYASLVTKLVEAGDANELLALYPRLPGTSGAELSTISQKGDSRGLPPVTWAIVQDASMGGAFLVDESEKSAGYLDLFADPGHSGVVATKIFHKPEAKWLEAEVEAEGATGGAEAHIVLSCVGRGDAAVTSPNLANGAATIKMALPGSCPLTKVAMILSPGTERDTLKLVVRSMSVY